MKKELTEKQSVWLDHYIQTGDSVEAARKAGYSEASVGTLASRLKRDLSEQIAEGLKEQMANDAPVALAALMEIVRSGKNEASRVKAAADLLDRSGFKPVDRHADVSDTRTLPEMVGQLSAQLGPDLAQQVLRRRGIAEQAIKGQFGADYVAGEQPAQLAEVPETKADRQHRRTLAEQAEQRRRFNVAKRSGQ